MPSVPYIRFYTDFPRHRKTMALRRILGAYEYIVNLWCWAAENAPNGDISSYTVEEIEFEARWTGEKGKALAAFIDVGFIDSVDGKMKFHNWMSRTGQGVEQLVKYREKKKLKQRERRVKVEQVGNVPGSDAGNVPGNIGGNPITLTLSSSGLSPDPDTRDPSSTEYQARRGDHWFNSFKAAWSTRNGRQYGKATPSDSQACGNLTDLVESLPADEVLALWERRSEVFAEYFDTANEKTIKAGCLFSWFVASFRGFMIPKDKRPAPKVDDRKEYPHGRPTSIHEIPDLPPARKRPPQ